MARSGTPPRRLARLLATLCERLPDERLGAVRQVLETAAGPDDVLVSRFIAAQTAAGLAQQLLEITQAWHAEAPGMTGAGLALALATARSYPRPRAPQVVISGPMSASIPARLTSGVAMEVIRSATQSLLIASFAAHGVRDVVRELAQAVDRGVHVDLMLEESTQAAAAFAALPKGVRIWHRVEALGVLHAKLIVADRHTALLGSANLTDRALSDNIELGVVLRDPKLVDPLIEHFRWLLVPENNVMRRA
ncbi:DISARM system phospholipase D-like protein DrmC [Streptomyces evansiae]|uniref:DISARM system phospholipase D-like protein DrmC n=1 Tax=Streptomyces evansiae TaxID=3075535 RepID=UPI002887B51F|nr:DISARM system phospholipase D-like protein DrmC [Streptomyces sp. DSM 41859]MDT0422981.1 DISARM system phospholipase D-like protein DrmC [Streptomyces sp. DSM 41859]